ncbi:alpha/beta hydrolase [Euzebya pacifica]|jgi:acetyl esterase/lipase|uniref:alpha/beta hydrolase n=1 Tax=Euzebya pacifica TaxID=1608957 RepID=UPI0030F78BBE
MRVSKGEMHADLRRWAAPLSILPAMMTNRRMVAINNALADRLLVGRDLKGLDCRTVQVPSSGGTHRIRTRVYRPADHDGPLPVLVYVHGGGYITGNPEMSGPFIKRFVGTRPCVVVAPAYRRAHDAAFPAGFDDCWDVLTWVRDNAEVLGSNGRAVAVGGHSAGGGLTAALSLKARDTGAVDIGFQMPFYPMIDDTQPDDPSREVQAPVWNTDANRAGWAAYLADLRRRGEAIPPYAAPARATDLAGLPPTITFVGTAEPFHLETVAYVEGLRAAGVEVAFREYEGCFHAFEGAVPRADVSRDAQDFTYDTFGEFHDRYLLG